VRLLLDDYSRFIIAWKLCTTMRADDVTDTLELALAASGCDSAKVVHKPVELKSTAPQTLFTKMYVLRRCQILGKRPFEKTV
jgi:putative transposase